MEFTNRVTALVKEPMTGSQEPTDPNQAKAVPESLAEVPRTLVAQRTTAGWRTRSAPSASSP